MSFSPSKIERTNPQSFSTLSMKHSNSEAPHNFITLKGQTTKHH